MSEREYLFSVSIHDCEVQTFRAGGKGGQHQNKTDSGCRVIHHPSGARGESREHRSQLQNKREAFNRMADSREFQNWCQRVASRLPNIEQVVEKQLTPDRLLVERKNEDGKWEYWPPQDRKGSREDHAEG